MKDPDPCGGVPARFACMPNGDAFRADTIRAVRVLPDDTLPDAPRSRYAVFLEFEDDGRHCIGSDLTEEAAIRLARTAVEEINARLAESRCEAAAADREGTAAAGSGR